MAVKFALTPAQVDELVKMAFMDGIAAVGECGSAGTNEGATALLVREAALRLRVRKWLVGLEVSA